MVVEFWDAQAGRDKMSKCAWVMGSTALILYSFVPICLSVLAILDGCLVHLDA